MTLVEPKSLRERQKLRTHEHILNAAGNLFGEKGFASTSIDDIISAAGTSRATLYAYFEGKDALLAAIVERMWVEGRRFYEDFGRLPDWSPGSIIGWLRSFATAYERDAARNKAAAVAAPAIFSEAPEQHREMIAAVRAHRQLWASFPEHEADLRASMVVNLVDAQLADYFFHGSPLDVEAFVGLLADAVRAVLGVA
ncbi:TetR/AcrR family transcriptional regulator [Rhodococcus koreensis]